MALSKGIQVLRVGAEGNNEPIAAPLGSAVTVYPGSIALSRVGYLANANAPQVTDKCLGLIGAITGGTGAETGQSITGNGSQGPNGVWIDCLTGTFLLASGTGADTLSEATAGATVYVVDEQTVGATDGSGTRPVAGVQLPIDPTIPTGFVPVKMANPAS